MAAVCPLCASRNDPAHWRDERLRVISAGDADYPAFLRVIWSGHVREMTDLPPPDRDHLLRVVLEVEAALRALVRPDKVNLAAFGNQVSHLHWHVIPRFVDDAHFPEPVWGVRHRAGTPRPLPAADLAAHLARVLGPGVAVSP